MTHVLFSKRPVLMRWARKEKKLYHKQVSCLLDTPQLKKAWPGEVVAGGGGGGQGLESKKIRLEKTKTNNNKNKNNNNKIKKQK